MSASIRILYDHQVFSRQYAGGASRYFYELSRQFSAMPQIAVELLIGTTATIYPLRQLSGGARVRACDGPQLNAFWNYTLNEVFGNCVAPFLGKVDVYHPTLYRIMPGVRSRAVVATHHDCTQERFPQEFRYVDKVMRAKRSLYAAADAIICVSESSRQDLLEIYGVDRSRTHVIYHGLTRLQSDAGAAAKVARQTRREYLLYVGSRARYKNFAGLLAAFRDSGLHRSFDLLALGGGPWTGDEANLLAKLDLTGCVSVVPSATDELLAAAYEQARLFVYPSFSEGFGMPPLEAMSLGCAVLASHASSIPEICRDAPFYFDPGDQDSFSRQMLRAVSDDNARRSSIERGRQVCAQYRWEKCARETISLYRTC